ncbi:MAG: polysaccharide biosynthesis tyrosine autokinase [Planctomycetota bacterium]
MERQKDFKLEDVIHIILKRKWVIIGFFLVVVATASVLSFRAQPRYRSTATLVIEPPKKNILSHDQLYAMSYFSFDRYHRTQQDLLQSPRLIASVFQDASFSSNAWAEYEGLSESDRVSRAIANLEVEPQEDSYLVDVGFKANDAHRAQLFLDALIERFRAENAQRSAQGRREIREYMDRKVTELESALDQSLEDLTGFEKQHEAVDFEGKYELVYADYKSYLDAARLLRVELADFEPEATTLEGILEGGVTVHTSHPVLDSSAELAALRQRLADVLASYAGARLDLGENNEELQILISQRSELEDAIVTETKAMLRGRLAAIAEKRAALASIEEICTQRLGELDTLGALRREYENLKESVAKNRELHLEYVSQQRETLSEEAEQPTENNIRIENAASEPDSPYFPNIPLNVVLAALLGIIGGFGLACFLEYLDDTVKSQDDVNRLLELPTLGMVATFDRRADPEEGELITHSNPKSVISEAYRGIRTNLSFGALGGDRRVVLVTSSNPGEGKSLSSSNLAVALAQGGNRTLLVDADFRKPRIHKIFNMDNAMGITNTLGQSQIPLDEVIRNTPVESLYLLTSGPIPPNPSELLGSQRMRQVLQQLREKFDFVVFDSPPVNFVTDASVLSQLVDCTVLIVHAGETRSRTAQRAVEQLRTVGSNLGGVILNNVDLHRGGGSYRYYYQYGYAYRQYGEPSTQPRRSESKQKV